MPSAMVGLLNALSSSRGRGDLMQQSFVLPPLCCDDELIKPSLAKKTEQGKQRQLINVPQVSDLGGD